MSQAQVAAISQDVAAYLKANPANDTQGYDPGSIIGYGPGISGFNETGGAPGSFGSPSPSNITINITGMTPANAQQVASQMVAALKQAGIGKLT